MPLCQAECTPSFGRTQTTEHAERYRKAEKNRKYIKKEESIRGIYIIASFI